MFSNELPKLIDLSACTANWMAASLKLLETDMPLTPSLTEKIMDYKAYKFQILRCPLSVGPVSIKKEELRVCGRLRLWLNRGATQIVQG